MQGNKYFIRTCQECGHQQAMKPPSEQKNDDWKNAKCRKCQSEALDYGSGGWVINLITGKFERE